MHRYTPGGSIRSRPKAVIFDLDGCLVDSEPLSLEAIAAEMRALGVADATAEEIGGQFLGVAMPVIAAYVSKRLGRPVPEGFGDRVEGILLETYKTELKPIPGADALLTGLRDQGIGLAIATGGSKKRMAATLKCAGLDGWFSGTAYSAEEVTHGKPAPDLFLMALERQALSASDCVVVEDSPLGIKGALAAGIPAVGFVGGSHLTERRDQHADVLRMAGASEIFDSLADVGAYVTTLPVEATS